MHSFRQIQSLIINSNRSITVLTPVVAVLLCAIVVPYVFNSLRRCRAAQALGCKTPRRKMGRVKDFYTSLRGFMNRSYLESSAERYADMGPTYESSFFGWAMDIYTVEPENVRAILASEFEAWGMGYSRRYMLRDLITNAIFVNDGKPWEHSRSLLRPSFKKINTENTSFFERHFQELLKALPPVNPASDLIDVDLQPLFLRMTLDSATELLLGESFHSQSAAPDSRANKFLKAFDCAVRSVVRENAMSSGPLAPIGFMRWILRLGAKTEYQKACAYIHEVIDDMIEQRARKRQHQKENPDDTPPVYVFQDEIASQTQDKRRIRDEIISVMFAGRDSTGSLLSSTMFMLARRPDVWNQFRAEVEMTFNGRLPDQESLRRMKVLKNILNESLRMFPTVPFNSRTAMADTTLPRGGGPDGQDPIFIPAGTRSVYHSIVMHKNPDVWGPDAEKWEPSRWEDPNLKPGWNYIPFNGGPRICPGQTFSMAETMYILARMAQIFKSVERRDPKLNFEWRVGLSSMGRRGTKVALAEA